MVYKIYISTTKDDNEYLIAVQQALFSINEIGLAAVSQEDIPILGDKRHDAARKMIQDSEIFLGLYKFDYGKVPEGETESHEEIEYRLAVEAGKSILVFAMEGAMEQAEHRQKEFLHYVMQHQVVTAFKDAQDLSAKVKVALDNYRKTRKHRQTLRPPMPSFMDKSGKSKFPAPPAPPGRGAQEQEATVDEDETFEEQVNRAVEIAGSDIEQIVRRALELHDAQTQVSDKPAVSEAHDNKVTVEPIWGEPIRRSQFQSDIFMVMPFRERFNGIYTDVIRPVTAELNMTIKRGDEFHSTRGSIMQEVWAALNACKIVIVETSDINANVYYELGIAHTLGKPAILITQTTDVQELPFDIRHLRFVVYADTEEGRATLGVQLKKSIIALINDLDEQVGVEM